MNTKVYNQLNRACLKAQKQGLTIYPGKFGVEVIRGVWKPVRKRVCPLGAYLIGKRAYTKHFVDGLSINLSYYLRLQQNALAGIAIGFDSGVSDEGEYMAIGGKLRKKFYPIK